MFTLIGSDFPKMLLSAALLAAGFASTAGAEVVAGRDPNDEAPAEELPETAHGATIARAFPDDATWTQIVTRGDAARFLFDALSAAPEIAVERTDGTVFRVRSTAAMGCARSDRFATPRFACVSFLKADGTAANGVLDPEFGATARIGVGN